MSNKATFKICCEGSLLREFNKIKSLPIVFIGAMTNSGPVNHHYVLAFQLMGVEFL